METSKIGKAALYPRATIEGKNGQGPGNQKGASVHLGLHLYQPPWSRGEIFLFPISFPPHLQEYILLPISVAHTWLNQFNYLRKYIFRPWRWSGWKGEEKKTKKSVLYSIISFIWRRFENNSPLHLSLSGHIIHKWSLQNINSISIKGGWISTHEGWIYQIITLEGTLVASKYFPVRGNQKQTAEY